MVPTNRSVASLTQDCSRHSCPFFHLPKHNYVVDCTYDVTSFSALVVMDNLRARPQVSAASCARTNYTPPEKFLGELRSRRLLASRERCGEAPAE
jgi:hypothetical protein